MKQAPNVKQLPKDKFTEAVIFAGADAYSHAQHWIEHAGKEAGDSIPPVYLGPKQLTELDNLSIIDKGRRCARVYLAGDIEPIMINAIAEKLALAGVEDAKLYKGIPDRAPENWRDYLARLREQAERGESMVGDYYDANGKKPVPKVLGDLSKMPPSQRGRLLAQRYGRIAILLNSKRVYAYSGGIWERKEDYELEREMVAIFLENQVDYKPYEIEDAVNSMKLEIPVLKEQRKDIIGFANGVYDLSNSEFLPHSPNHWLLQHNGIVYTPSVDGESIDKHAPVFYGWLMHSADGDKNKAVRICAGLFMAFANRYDWQMFIEVVGAGGSGKSIFTNTAELLVGTDNVASGSLSAMDDAAGRGQFVGKRLITLPDQSRYRGEGAGLKAITGCDRVEVNEKYEKRFSTRINAVVIITANKPMLFTEHNGGIARRRVIYKFDEVVSESIKDPKIMDKISCELPVIIRYLLSTFSDGELAHRLLIEQRDSDEGLSVKSTVDPLYAFCDYIMALNEPVGMYMGNAGMFPRRPRLYLYHAYLEYMEAYGHKYILDLTKFGETFPVIMREYGAEYIKKKDKRGIRYNMDLKETAEEWLPYAPPLK